MVKPIIIDTATGVDPHVYSTDMAAILNSYDGGDCVKDYLDNLSASIISANEVRLAPGLFAVQGHYALIPYGDYVSCAIGNGQTGYKRYDLIVARFTRTAGVDDITINVIQGTPSTGTPTVPSVTVEDLEQGGDLREFKLYLVYIDGLTISSVTAQFSVLPSLSTINTNLTANSNQFIFAYDSATSSYGYKAGGADTFHPFKSAIVNGNASYTAVTTLSLSIPAGVKEVYVVCTQSMNNGTFYSFTGSGTPYVSISTIFSKQTMSFYPYYSIISIYKITLNGTAGTLTLTPTGGTAGSSFNLVYNYFY